MSVVRWIVILLVRGTVRQFRAGHWTALADGPEGAAAIDKKKSCTLHTTQFPQRWGISGTWGTARGVSGPLTH